MPRVTAELLRSARSGNSDALYEFAMVIETRNKPSYIDIVLEHLRVDQLPAADTPTGRWRSHVQTATPSLVCVAASAEACRSNPGVRKSTAAKIIEGFDGIIGWMDLIMRHWPTFYVDWKQDIASVEGLFSHISLLLSSLIGLEDQIALAVFSSVKVLSSVHHMWSFNLENHPERAMPTTETCAVIKLVTNIVVHSSSEGKFHLLQSLVSNPSLLWSFCEGLSWRFRNTITYHEQHNSSIDTVARLNSLAMIALLFKKANDPAVSGALRHSGCFRSWTMALIELQGMLSSHLHFHLITAVTLATNRHGLPAHSVSDMVAAGLIPLFVSSFSREHFEVGLSGGSTVRLSANGCPLVRLFGSCCPRTSRNVRHRNLPAAAFPRLLPPASFLPLYPHNDRELRLRF
ncbi:hypothetical protein BKA70DRAFT_684294 [Coprinopsis sp. MPI-PUGE-AT-0042]|nr:hypothetical protein BKA70DRAFT_684294 [Coprinopsis sp. MPI-PUGE-AT-0042]